VFEVLVEDLERGVSSGTDTYPHLGTLGVPVRLGRLSAFS
jgi:hypothetical protein